MSHPVLLATISPALLSGEYEGFAGGGQERLILLDDLNAGHPAALRDHSASPQTGQRREHQVLRVVLAGVIQLGVRG